MKKRVVLALAVLLLFCTVGTANAVLTTYNSEVEYLAALSGYGYGAVEEGFESAAWDPSRPDGISSITNLGITWTASDLVRTGEGWARGGLYGVFDSYGDPDYLYNATSTYTIYGVGGWFATTDATEIIINLGGSVGSFYLGDFSPHVFCGLIETDGAYNAKLYTSTGHWGADDFTFAAAIPDPATLLLLGTACLVGMGALGRKKFKKA